MCLAVPGRVIVLDGPTAKVDFGGVVRSVRMDLLPEVAVGDHVLVHAGYAIQTISAEDAAETLALLNELAETDGVEIA